MMTSMQLSIEKMYITKDFYVAAYLIACGHQISNINRSDPKRVFFAFKEFEGREDLIRAFLCGKTVVEPLGFIAAQKKLKGLIYSYD
jgi:hypothetical protein